MVCLVAMTETAIIPKHYNLSSWKLVYYLLSLKLVFYLSSWKLVYYLSSWKLVYYSSSWKLVYYLLSLKLVFYLSSWKLVYYLFSWKLVYYLSSWKLVYYLSSWKLVYYLPGLRHTPASSLKSLAFMVCLVAVAETVVIPASFTLDRDQLLLLTAFLRTSVCINLKSTKNVSKLWKHTIVVSASRVSFRHPNSKKSPFVHTTKM